MPTALAAPRCPCSCSEIEGRTARAPRHTPRTFHIGRYLPDRCRERACHGRPGDLSGQLGEVAVGGRQYLREVPGVVGEHAAGGGQPGGAPAPEPGPVQQGHPGLGLQPRDVLGHRGRCEVQHGRGSEDAAGAGDGPEHGEPPRVDWH
jgi:hypothetical protein